MRHFSYILFLLTSFLLVHCSPKVGQGSDKAGQKAPAAESFRSSAPPAGPAPVIQIGTYEQFKLDNGLTVIVVENDKIPRVSWQLYVDVPPFMEGEKAGLSDIAGQLLSRGTTNMSKSEIDQAIDYIGASFNTSANGFFAASLTKHQDRLLEVMSDVLMNPAFPEDEFQKIVRQTMSGLAQAKTDPGSLVSSVGNHIVYGEDHPYGEIESEKTINAISSEDCKTFYQTFFRPSSSYLVVVGDINVDKARAQAQKYFGKWMGDSQDVSSSFDIPQSPGERKLSFINRDGAVQSVLRLSFPYEMKPGDPDAIKASVMNSLLGGFFNSRVNLNLREDKGYTYGARTSMGTDRYVASFTASASVRNEVTDSAIHEFLFEIGRLQNELVSEEELDLVKSVVTGNFALSLERPQTVANFALNTARYNLPADYYKNYLKMVSEITPEDIRNMANKYLQPEDLHIIVVGNEDDIAEKLLPFDDSGEIDFYDSEGNLIQKNAIALPKDLSVESIVNGYLEALGPKASRDAIKILAAEYSMEAMGTTLGMKIVQARPDKFLMSFMAQGMEVSKQALNGDKGYVAQMGQKQDADEETMEDMRAQAMIFEEEYYLDKDYTYELKSIETLNGVNCYKVSLTKPDGSSQTIFFDAETGLKVRSSQTEEQDGQSATIIQDFKDYKEVNGVLFPHTVITSGAFPVPLEAKITSIEVNPDLDEAIFKIEE